MVKWYHESLITIKFSVQVWAEQPILGNKMIEEAIEAIKKSSKESSIYVGTDSIRFKKNGTWNARYSTVIILHMDSKHGCKLFHETLTMPDYGNLKQRLLNEVSFAVDAASKIIDVIEDRHLEIHLDINKSPKHKSNVAIKEALGYVLGSFGFEPKFKPEAFAATHAADQAVRNKPC